MSCDQLVERLRHDATLLDEYLPASGHGTMRSTIEWSLSLLDPAIAGAISRICTFPGGATLPTLEAFLGPDADRVVARLVDASLLRSQSAPGGRRFRVLEPVRDVCLARLDQSGETMPARLRNAEVLADLATDLARGLASPDEADFRLGRGGLGR
jgi:hypothetical protein